MLQNKETGYSLNFERKGMYEKDIYRIIGLLTYERRSDNGSNINTSNRSG